MDRTKNSHDYSRRENSPTHIRQHVDWNTPTSQRQKARAFKAKVSDHESTLDLSDSSHDDAMPPQKTDDVELITVPLREAPHYHNDLEKRQQSSYSKTNFFTSAASLKAISSCLLYSFCSVSMILTNKSLASR